jgi:hypothetical protein
MSPLKLPKPGQKRRTAVAPPLLSDDPAQALFPTTPGSWWNYSVGAANLRQSCRGRIVADGQVYVQFDGSDGETVYYQVSPERLVFCPGEALLNRNHSADVVYFEAGRREGESWLTQGQKRLMSLAGIEDLAVAGHTRRCWRVDAYNLDAQLLEQIWFAPGIGIARKAMHSAGLELVLTDYHLAPRSQAAALKVESDDPRSEVGLGFFPTGLRVPFTLDGMAPEPVMVSALADAPEVPLARMILLQPGARTDVRLRRRWTRINLDPEAPEELNRCAVTSICADAKGAAWLGTLGRGLFYCNAGLWTRFDRRNSLADDYISAVLEDDSGRIWVGTQGRGLACLERRDDCWTWRLHHKGNSALRDDFISALLLRSEGLWVGTETGALALMNAEGSHHVSLPDSCPDQRVTSLATAGDCLLVGTDAGLWEWSGGAWQLVAGSGQHRVRGLGVREDGSLWWGNYRGGAFFSKDGEVGSLSLENGFLINNNVWCVHPDGANLWLGTGRGSAFFEMEGEPTTYGADSIACITRVGAQIWLGTNIGLQILEPWRGEEGR